MSARSGWSPRFAPSTRTRRPRCGSTEAGFVYLQELTGKEWEQASEDLALSYQDWCDPVEE